MKTLQLKVESHTKFVSISGTTISEKNNSELPLWYWGIKPLNQGDYELSKFYNSLNEISYTGQIAIHTWGIEANFGLKIEEHLPNSLDILLNMKKQICK